MKKLMDLYTSHIEEFMGRKENLKTTSRVILANNGRFEGITTDIENKPVSFIFGNVFEDEIEVYDMPLKSELATLFLKGQKDGYKYQGIYKMFIEGFEVETNEPCEMIISDGDIVREVKEDEIEFIIKATKNVKTIAKNNLSKRKRNLSAENKNVYNSYISKFKKKNDDIKEKFAVKK